MSKEGLGLPSWQRTSEQRSEAIEVAARAVLDSGLRRGRSAIDPSVQAWTADVAADLYTRIVEQTDTGPGSFQEKLKTQLSGTDRATHLLAAELMYLQVLPLKNVTSRIKMQRIETVLSWMEPPASLPRELAEGLQAPGAFSGGTGFNVQIWRQIGWLLSFVRHWWTLDEKRRTSTLDHPWEFRQIVASMPSDQPGIRNSLLYLTFPDTFFPVVSQDNKRAIRDAFVDLIQNSSGSDPISVDRDLFAIHKIHLQRDPAVNYYSEPYVSQWRKLANKGERAWLIRPREGGQNLLDMWLEEGFVSLSGAHLAETKAGTPRALVRAAVEEGFQHLDYAQRLSLTTDFYSFLSVMTADDYIVVEDNDILYVGVVTGTVGSGGESGELLTRSMAWSSKVGMEVSGGWDALSKHMIHYGSVIDITAQLSTVTEFANALAGATQPADAEDSDIQPVGPIVLRTPTDQLISRTHSDHDWLQKIITLLQDRRQIVLYGPPGTGKTYLARELAHHLTGADAIRVVQFHPSYAYEDFFEGFRPAKSQDGSVGFELVPGPLRQIAAEARADQHRPYVLIVDEINRANLAKVFGELYYLLEYRDEAIQLQYSPAESFTLPPNVYFIGTMNTADRSIALVDTALRRRFAFVELHPDQPPVANLLPRWLLHQGKSSDERATLLAALNAEIGTEDRDFKIGPAYLMTSEAGRDGGLNQVWEYSILPLLEEHYYGRLSRQEVRERFGLDTIRGKTATEL